MSRTKESRKSKSPSKGTEGKLAQNLTRLIQQFMEGKGYLPSTEEELLRKLALPPIHKPLLHKILQQLVKSEFLVVYEDRYSPKTIGPSLLRGTIRVHPRGFGFVVADNPALFPEDVFIPKSQINFAVDSDKVEVLVLHRGVGDKGPEGRVVSVLQRSRSHVAGMIWAIEGDQPLAYVPLLGNDHRVRTEVKKKQKLRLGDRVALEILSWGDKESDTVGRVLRVLGNIDDPSCDVPAAIEEYALQGTFPKSTLQEARQFGSRVKTQDLEGREDLRSWETFTIDPDTAKDFDDAISLTKDGRGRYHLGVHIADVSHYVTPGSALDQEARQRGNSVYFPGYCLPMLPEELSSNLCSLKPKVNRLTVSVLMTYDSRGQLLDYHICRSVIRSAKRFTYSEAKQVLDGKKVSPHAKTLKLMTELCGHLKRKRQERGSLEFALPDLIVVVDEAGLPTGTQYVEYDITHQMVEEFMLKANELVAKHLSDQGKNLTFRIHEQPSDEEFKDFSAFVSVFGFKLPTNPTAADMQGLFEEAVKTPYGQYLATNYIRRMKMAYYSPNNLGHYGLSLEHYCHFTSPIRRYVDIIAHRLLFGQSDDIRELQQISDICSEQERIASKAENRVNLLKKLRLLKQWQEEDSRREYEGIVTEVKNFGIVFDVPALMLDGFLHVSELEADYFVFDNRSRSLQGRHHGISYTAGDKIALMVKSVDLIFLETLWHLVGTSCSASDRKSPTPKTRRSRGRR